MLIRNREFAGESPKQSSRLRAKTRGERVIDCEIVSGELRAIPTDTIVGESVTEDPKTIFEIDGDYITWPGIVDAWETPIDAGPRLIFYTGDGPPKQAEADELLRGKSYRLGLPEPVSAPSVANFVPEEEFLDKVTVTYIVAFVNRWGVLGAASPVSNEVTYQNGNAVVVTTNVADTQNPEDYAVENFRLFRNNVGSDEYFFVGEYPLSQSVVLDDTSQATNELYTQRLNYPPPVDMIGLHLMSTVGLGFRPGGKTVYVSELNNLNAWPYSFTVTSEIVGLSSYGNTAVVVTKGYPETAVIVDPSNIVPVRSTEREPCVSRRGILQIAGGVAWPTPSSLFFIGRGGEQKWTRDTHDDKDWAALQPSTFNAGYRDGQYFAFYGQNRQSGGVFIFDTREEMATVRRQSIWSPAIATREGSDDLFAVQGFNILKLNAGVGRKIYLFESSCHGEGSPFALTSRSILSDDLLANPTTKALVAIRETEAVQLAARNATFAERVGTRRGLRGSVAGMKHAGKPVAGNSLAHLPDPVVLRSVTLRVYGDGVLIHEEDIFQQGEGRLRFADRARLWHYELEGDADITQLDLASSFSEMHTGS